MSIWTEQQYGPSAFIVMPGKQEDRHTVSGDNKMSGRDTALRRLTVLHAMALFLLLPLLCHSSDPITIYLRVNGDAKVKRQFPNTNYDEQNLEVALDPSGDPLNPYQTYTLLYFDLSKIPTRATILDATLNIYCYDTDDGVGLGFLPLIEPWEEESVTWNIMPDIAIEPSSSHRNVLPGLNYVGLTGIVRHWYEKENYGMQVRGSCQLGERAFFYDRTSSTGNFAGLTVTYSLENYDPYVPSNPIPADGAVDVSFLTKLAWQCTDRDGDPLYYSVYFERDDPSPDNIIKSGALGATADPGMLQYDAHYYWKVVASDHRGGSSTSPVWSFWTQLPPGSAPKKAINPAPLHTAILQPLDVKLGWTNAGGATSYNVYFGTDSTPDSTESKGNTTYPFFNPGALLPATTYYWRIDTKNSSRTTTGDVWSFTTASTPVQIVTAPRRGQKIGQYQPVTIQWESWAYPQSSVRVELHKGIAVHAVLTEGTKNDGKQDWLIPMSAPVGNDYRIVISTTDRSIAHASGVFSIMADPQAGAKHWEGYR